MEIAFNNLHCHGRTPSENKVWHFPSHNSFTIFLTAIDN